MTWTSGLAACFGSADKKFAGHPSDRGRAKDLLINALNEGCTYERFRGEIESYLVGLNCLPAHVEAEMSKVILIETYFD